MKTLFLLRHAKSSWDDPKADDFDRPLAKRGRDDAPRIGALMATRGWLPQRALVSSAARTRQTWERVSGSLPQAAETRFERTLYMAKPQTILDMVCGLPETAASAIVVGHNPGMEDCARLLAGEGSEPEAQIQMSAKFPTGALARFVHEGTWAELAFGGAMLTDFVRPHDLDAD